MREYRRYRGVPHTSHARASGLLLKVHAAQDQDPAASAAGAAAAPPRPNENQLRDGAGAGAVAGAGAGVGLASRVLLSTNGHGRLCDERIGGDDQLGRRRLSI